MNIVIDRKTEIAEWVAGKVGHGGFHQYEAIGIERDGELIAGVVYDNYAKDARISMHCAGVGKRWLNREFLRLAFAYPFKQLGVKVIVNTVRSDNEDSIRFTEHCGFTEVGRVKNGCGDADLIIYKLCREDCRWLGV